MAMGRMERTWIFKGASLKLHECGCHLGIFSQKDLADYLMSCGRVVVRDSSYVQAPEGLTIVGILAVSEKERTLFWTQHSYVWSYSL